jgi:hypothetical protein
MANHEDTIRRWRQVIEGTTTKSFLKNYNIVSGHDGIYSYGRHFPLAIPLRQDGTLVGYLLNGDVYSVSTSRHQREVRSGLEGHDLPTITVPFSALRSAGVEPRDVRIVDTTPATFVQVERVVTEGRLPNWATYRWQRGEQGGEPDPDVTRLDDGNFLVRTTQHRLGEAVFEAKVERMHRCPGHTPRIETPSEPAPQPGMFDLWHEYRAAAHAWSERLAAGEITVTVAPARCDLGHDDCRGVTWERRVARFLSGWDSNDFTYFLSELPGMPDTVAEAYESLKPQAVLAAEADGRDVLRQGDVFVIPTALTTRDLTKRGAVRTRMGAVFGTNHEATETAVLPDGTTLVRGTLRHRPHGRRPDHRALKVADGKTWGLAARNTVPLMA